MARIVASGHSGFLTDRDLFSPEELRESETHHLFLHPNQLGDGAGTVVALPTGDIVGFGLMYPLDRGPVPRKFVRRLDALRPHMVRAAFTAARLQLERATAMGHMLEAIGLPAFVFDETGKILAPNVLIEALSDYVLWRARDRITLRVPRADAQFKAACESIGIDSSGPPRSFAVPGINDAPTMVAHVVPIRRTACDIFARCAGALILTPATLPQAPPAELIQSLFDLTPAEARVARGIAGGANVEEIALASRVSVNTVRTQVRALLTKTGCTRQAEIVGLLTGLSVVRNPEDEGSP